jgi:hypothetical protein
MGLIRGLCPKLEFYARFSNSPKTRPGHEKICIVIH